MRSLTDYRDLWPQLLADINNALPQLPADPAKIKAIPRNQRAQVLVDAILTRYEPNIGPAVADPEFGKKFANATGTAAQTGGFVGFAPAGVDPGYDPAMMEGDPAMASVTPEVAPPAVAPAAGAAPVVGAPTTGHGFIITLQGSTPHADPSSFLEGSVIKNLEALALDKLPPGKPYYVAKAEIVTTTPLKNNAARLAEMKRLFDAAELAKGNPLTPGANAAEILDGDPAMADPALALPTNPQGVLVDAQGKPLEDARPYRDRMLNAEDVREDSEFVIVFAVVLDPPAAPAATAAPADDAAPVPATP